MISQGAPRGLTLGGPFVSFARRRAKGQMIFLPYSGAAATAGFPLYAPAVMGREGGGCASGDGGWVRRGWPPSWPSRSPPVAAATTKAAPARVAVTTGARK